MKLLRSLLITGVIALAGGYLLLAAGLRPLSLKAVQYLRENSGKYGAKLVAPRFEEVHLISWNGAAWSKVTAEFRSLRKGSAIEGQRFTFSADRLELFALFPPGRRFRLQADRLELTRKDNARAQPRAVEAIRGTLTYDFPLNAFNPAAVRLEVRGLLRRFSELVHEGRIEGKLVFEGAGDFRLGGKSVEVLLETREEQGYSWLVMSPEGVRNAARAAGDTVTDSEINLIARYPFRAARLLEIRDYARSTAEAAEQRNPEVPMDAYKHVLWSYLLTREYGPDFSVMVTDAHEKGATRNTEQEHRMDYNNNRVGRFYAEKGYPEDGLLKRLMRDPQVIVRAE